MSEMQTWIEKNIHPPGVQKKNRGSLFALIAQVFGLVKADAIKAFNAHFPYLSDEKKLEEHGSALLVPHMLHDSDSEYRDRVATASFFLTRAGERSYIIEQLSAHFEDRYLVSDEFLQVYIKVRDLDDTDRHWLLEFLDELINPNVKLSVAEWFHFIEKVVMSEILTMRSQMNLCDTFNDRCVKLNGRVKLDGHTVNATVKERAKLNGYWKLDGTISLSGALLALEAKDAVRVPVKLGRGILDSLGIRVKPEQSDQYHARVKLNGAIKLDSAEKLHGFGRVNDKIALNSKMGITDSFTGICEQRTIAVKPTVNDRYRLHLSLNGAVRLNSYAKLDGYSGAFDKVHLRAASGHFERYRARLRLNGAVRLEGSEGLSGFAGITDRLKVGLRYCRKLNGHYQLDGSIQLNSGILLAA